MNVMPVRNNLADMSIDQLKMVADQIGKSKMFEAAQTPERAFTLLVIGQSLGLNMLQAMNDLTVGKKGIEVKAIVMASMIRRHPNYDYEINKLDDDGCIISFLRIVDGKKELLGQSKFGPAEAAKAELTKKETYLKHPRDMYYNRAMSSGAKKHCPDALGGASIYVEGELYDETPPVRTLASVTHLQPRNQQDDAPPAATDAPPPNTDLAAAIRALVGTSPRAIKRVDDFLRAMFDGTTLQTIETLEQQQLEAIFARLNELKAKKREAATAGSTRKEDRGALPATAGQRSEIERLRQLYALSEDAVATIIVKMHGEGATIDTITRKQASQVIDHIKVVAAA